MKKGLNVENNIKTKARATATNFISNCLIYPGFMVAILSSISAPQDNFPLRKGPIEPKVYIDHKFATQTISTLKKERSALEKLTFSYTNSDVENLKTLYYSNLTQRDSILTESIKSVERDIQRFSSDTSFISYEKDLKAYKHTEAFDRALLMVLLGFFGKGVTYVLRRKNKELGS